MAGDGAFDLPLPFVAPRSGGLRGYGSRRLFEAPIGRRVRARPPGHEHRRFTPEGGATQGPAFFCLLFFAGAKKSESPTGEIKPPNPAMRKERERAKHTRKHGWVCRGRALGRPRHAHRLRRSPPPAPDHARRCSQRSSPAPAWNPRRRRSCPSPPPSSCRWRRGQRWRCRPRAVPALSLIHI